MRDFIAVTLQFVGACSAYTDWNLQQPGRVLSFFRLKMARETDRAGCYKRAAESLSCCSLNQLRRTLLRVSLQPLL
jgi:hypothetical protein